MKLISVPEKKYDEYRLNVIFRGYKWDPQFIDNNTIAKHILVLTKDEANELKFLTERLGEETTAAETTLLNNLKLSRPLEIFRHARRLLPKIVNYSSERNIRLMRFDFHPVKSGGWAVSEVNSDVPGGFAEASLMPRLTLEMLKENIFDNGDIAGNNAFNAARLTYENFGKNLVGAIAAKVEKGGRIALVHCTAFSDDRQVMQFIGEKLKQSGFVVSYLAADHLIFKNKRAVSVLDGFTGPVDAIIRFTPIEWLKGLKKAWYGYFDTLTVSCNHPVAIFAQTKRFPFVWDSLQNAGVDLTFWQKLMPKTYTVKDAKNKAGIIFKPAYGRVGEGISIKNAISKEEYNKILKDVKRHPRRYVAQEKFESLPLNGGNNQEFHVCLGSYYLEGRAAGFYARISKTMRIDSTAADIPVLIEE